MPAHLRSVEASEGLTTLDCSSTRVPERWGANVRSPSPLQGMKAPRQGHLDPCGARGAVERPDCATSAPQSACCPPRPPHPRWPWWRAAHALTTSLHEIERDMPSLLRRQTHGVNPWKWPRSPICSPGHDLAYPPPARHPAPGPQPVVVAVYRYAPGGDGGHARGRAYPRVCGAQARPDTPPSGVSSTSRRRRDPPAGRPDRR